ncbi:MAG: cytochrome b [Thiotrichales bacterium]
MTERNRTRYNRTAIILHWGVALTVFGLFALGLWMVDLGYYDPWRKDAPEIHKAVGVLLFIAMSVRLVWRLLHPAPAPLASHALWERRAAAITHALLYSLLFATMVAGYLISTADGRAISVFGWFEVPATLSRLPNQEDIAGEVHFALAVTTLALVAAHALAALKHHFFDRDPTLLRMLGRATSSPET